MKSIQNLSSEHRAIARISTCFEREIEAGERDGVIDCEAFDKILSFFEVQVDGHHQEKEERIFLPRLLTRACGEDVELVRGLFDQHLGQRVLLTSMRNLIAGAFCGEPSCITVLGRQGRRYLALHREHSNWEQAVVFGVAQRTLTPLDDRAILNGFRRIDDLWGTSVCNAASRLEAWLDRRTSPVPA